MRIVENVTLVFQPEFEILEGEKDSKFMKIGGTALTPCVSKNNKNYSMQNLQENDGRKVKFLVGHPTDNIEDHLVGKGSLKLQESILKYEGKVMNTARHPDIIEKLQARLLGPSIHAKAKKITETNGAYSIEGLSIDAMGFVAFQGIEEAGIDYAVAESFQGIETIDEQESAESDEVKKAKGENMTEENQPNAQEPQEAEKPATPVVEAVAPPVVNESEKELKAVKEERDALLLKAKEVVVENILSVNKNLKKEDLLKESDDTLKLILEYEKKLSAKTEESAIVESDKVEPKKDSVFEADDGSIRLSETAYSEFNKEFKERLQ